MWDYLYVTCPDIQTLVFICNTRDSLSGKTVLRSVERDDQRKSLFDAGRLHLKTA